MFLSLVLRNLITVCLKVLFFIYFELEVHWASWTCRFITSLNLENTWPLFLQIFFPSDIPALGNPIKYTFGHLKFSHSSLIFSCLKNCFSSKKIIFLFVSFWIFSIAMSSRSLIFSYIKYTLLVVNPVQGIFHLKTSQTSLEVWFRSYLYFPPL